MPIFEFNYRAQTDTKKSVPPMAVLRKMGPLIAVTIALPQNLVEVLQSRGTPIPTPESGYALIDTGAGFTAVDESICRKLGLPQTGTAQMAHAGGVEQRPCFPVQITFPGAPLPPLQIVRAASVNLVAGKQPIIALLGREVLSRLRFVYNGPAGRIEIAY